MQFRFVTKLFGAILAAALVTAGAALAATNPAFIELAAEHGEDEDEAPEEEQDDESLEEDEGEEGDEADAPEGDGDPETLQEVDDEGDDEGEGSGENAEAFSAWVRSLPDDWGCIRGQLVSTVARQDPHEDDLEDWTFDSAAEAAEELGLSGRCVEVVLNGEGEDDDEEPVTLSDEGDVERGRPAHAGPPAHAASSADRGRPEGAGPPAHAGGGRR